MRYNRCSTRCATTHERVGESGEEESVRARHLGYCVAIAQRTAPRLVGSDEAAALLELDAERENLLSAHGFCDRAPIGAEQDLALVFALQNYWFPDDFWISAFA